MKDLMKDFYIKMLRNGMNITNKKELREVIVRLEIL
jgi:hypothetical protein